MEKKFNITYWWRFSLVVVGSQFSGATFGPDEALEIERGDGDGGGASSVGSGYYFGSKRAQTLAAKREGRFMLPKSTCELMHLHASHGERFLMMKVQQLYREKKKKRLKGNERKGNEMEKESGGVRWVPRRTKTK